ncbi:glutaminyl-peptide cyclotransferase [Qipengyuania spongiae]|uniref:Glutaminyl-peptide cyclotransferase n=1 Tax=Qipengyuania spongiae TaxID=2909673 RepID=A0ABY5T155_9SPHN|nr:glutaminyl-peptide cyclotransferase [Qipengyuania spongiae]UVI40532.1 glutaminyl-peptide cyclotransferase [Qipengyuania spongiae]
MKLRAIPVLFSALGLLGSTGTSPSLAQQATAAAPESAPAPETYSGPTVYRADIVATYPHDSAAFTQGLVWHNGALFESTGQEGQSTVRKVDLETGKVLASKAIPTDQFGEGLALWGDEFVSLTWRNGAIHRWNATTLQPAGSEEGFPFEGWGLTASPEGLIHSDGSATLRVLDPQTYEVRRTIPVTMNGRPLARLNELEMIDGLVYANVWESPYIVAIDPADGVVRSLIDLRAIVATMPMATSNAVLNGIAWDAENRRLFVTGKLWPNLFEIRLLETDDAVR